MTIYDLIDYIFEDSKVEIYMNDDEKTVFSGYVYDIPEQFKELEISTIEAIKNKLVINI